MCPQSWVSWHDSARAQSRSNVGRAAVVIGELIVSSKIRIERGGLVCLGAGAEVVRSAQLGGRKWMSEGVTRIRVAGGSHGPNITFRSVTDL